MLSVNWGNARLCNKSLGFLPAGCVVENSSESRLDDSQ